MEGSAMQAYLSFYRDTWLDSQYDWYVYMTGNSYQLNKVCYDYYKLNTNNQNEWNQISQIRGKSLTEDELLCLSGSMAERYHTEHSFPKILIVDLLVIQGTKIRSFLTDFELAILQEYNKTFGSLDQTIKRELHESFRKAVVVRVYAKSYMLPQSCSFIKSEKTMHISQWRGMLYNLLSNEFNGSYNNHIYLNLSQYKEFRNSESGWLCSNWVYGTVQMEIWQKPLIMDKDGNVKLLLSLQVQVSKDMVRVLPEVLFDNISYRGLPDIFDLIKKALGTEIQTNSKGYGIELILSKNYSCYCNLKTKWLIYVIGLLEFYGVFRNDSIEIEDFGITKSWIDRIYIIKDSLYSILNNHLSILFKYQNPKVFNFNCKNSMGYITMAENFLYESSINHEYDLWNEAKYWESSERLERSYLSDYITYCKGMNIVECIGALLAVIHSGITYIHINNGIKGKLYYGVMSVTAGNQALSIIPCKRYYRVLPALVKIEERCLHGGYQVKPNIIGFCKFINEYSIANELAEFYSLVSQFGYKLRDWNYDYSSLFDMLNLINNDSFVCESEVQSLIKTEDVRDYTQHERQKQLEYKNKVYGYRLI